MRSRLPLLTLILIVGSLVLPHVAHAGGIPFFGPIIPFEANKCAASWGLLITVINNIISFLITLAIIFVAPIMIAYAGFLFVINPVNEAGKTKAKGVLLNTIIGIVIALAGWMIVDMVMAVLYNADASNENGGVLGTWSSLITSGGIPSCIKLEASLKQVEPGQNMSGVSANGGVVSINGRLAQCSSSNTACSPAALQTAGLTPVQAAVMSCIAVTESSGNPTTPPYNIAHPGSNSSACGTFQIVRTTWSKTATGVCSDFSNCQDATCNLQVAKTLVSTSGYTPWTCANCNNKAAGCIQQYGG